MDLDNWICSDYRALQ